MKRSSEKGMALVITLLMLAIVTFMAVVFLALSRRERGNVKANEDQMKARALSDTALARYQTEMIARMINVAEADLSSFTTNQQHEAIANGRVQRAKFHYGLIASKAYRNDNGFTSTGNVDLNNVNYYDTSGNPIPFGSTRFIENVANLFYDPLAPVYVTDPTTKSNEFRAYLDLNRNGQYETNGTIYVATNGTYTLKPAPGNVATAVSGDLDWIGVLENPDFPHSETNRITGRIAYIALPMGRSLDLNFIHNAAKFDSAGNVNDIGSGTSHYTRNQGVGSWELNLAAFLRDFHTNVWRPISYNYDFLNASGDAFRDARGMLRYRLNDARTNLFTPFQALTNLASTADGIRFNTGNPDYVDMMSDGPFIKYEEWHTNAPVRYFNTKGGLDNDDPGRLWHGKDRVDKTLEYSDVQKIFNVGTGFKADFSGFYGRFTNAVMKTSDNWYDRYAYYRWIGQMGVDSVPALRGRINLNHTNEPGTLSTNLTAWVSPDGPVVMGRPRALGNNPVTGAVITSPVNNLTNFFLIAADAMLRASTVTNVYLDNKRIWRTNYTIGGSYYTNSALNSNPGSVYWVNGEPDPTTIANLPVRPNFSITNIQIYHFPTNATTDAGKRSLVAVTNAEYSSAVHRILQLSANIMDNMTNRGKIEPFFPTVFRPIYTRTPTNVIISGWAPQETAFAATNHLWTTAEAFYLSPGLVGTNVNLFGQPWVIGAKKGWPNFNEYSLESYVQLTRKLEIVKDAVPSQRTNLWVTNQITMLGVSNTFGIEAWNSYAATNLSATDHPIRIESRVVAQIGIDRIVNRATDLRVPTMPSVVYSLGASNYVVRGWAGRKPTVTALPFSQPANALTGDPESDFRVPVYYLREPLPDSQYIVTGPATGYFTNANAPIFQPLELTPQFRLVVTNRINYVAIDNNTGRIIDLVTLDNIVSDVDLATNLFQFSSTAPEYPPPSSNNVSAKMFWDSTPNPKGANTNHTVGIQNQVLVSDGSLRVGQTDWKNFSTFSPTTNEIAKFWDFLHNSTNDLKRMQAPFSPTRKIYLQVKFQANDPLVHYHAADLRVQEATEIAYLAPANIVRQNDDLGQLNVRRYRPWGTGPTGDPYGYDSRYKDPGIGSSDDWDFPISKLDNVSGAGIYGITNFHYRFPNIGDLGRVHRGTPWQTLYLKALPAPLPTDSPTQDKGNWAYWTGSWATHPTNDWKLVGLFTTAVTENAVRGLLSVNQTNTAAWSAVLSGVQVITNTVPDETMAREVGYVTPRFGDRFIEPGSPQLEYIVNNINAFRSRRPLGVFSYLGEFLGAPALSVAEPIGEGLVFTKSSPFLNPGRAPHPGVQMGRAFNDDVLEAIPRRILSLLKEDEPRVVVYCFGQTLKPAPRSFVTDPQYYNLCINYQVTGEFATKTILRVDGEVRNPNNPLRTVVESYEQLPPFE